MKRNYFIVDYTAQELLVVLAGQRFTFDLRRGEVGDYWSMIPEKQLEINFYQPSKYERPVVFLHGEYIQERYSMSIDFLGCLGNMDDYFGYVEMSKAMMDIKRLLMDKYLFKNNYAEKVVIKYADVIQQGIFDGLGYEGIVNKLMGEVRS